VRIDRRRLVFSLKRLRWKLSVQVKKERCGNWAFSSSETVHILWMSKMAYGSFWLNITSFSS